jgi:hypothetical protein
MLAVSSHDLVFWLHTRQRTSLRDRTHSVVGRVVDTQNGTQATADLHELPEHDQSCAGVSGLRVRSISQGCTLYIFFADIYMESTRSCARPD